MAEGVVRVDEAMVEFRKELELSPDDPLVNLRSGYGAGGSAPRKRGPRAARDRRESAGRRLAGLSISWPVPARARQPGRCRHLASQGRRALIDAARSVADRQPALSAGDGAPADRRHQKRGRGVRHRCRDRTAADRERTGRARALHAGHRRCARRSEHGDAAARFGRVRRAAARRRGRRSATASPRHWPACTSIWESCRHRPSASRGRRNCSRKRRRSMRRFPSVQDLARRRLFQRAAVRQSGRGPDAMRSRPTRPTPTPAGCWRWPR